MTDFPKIHHQPSPPAAVHRSRFGPPRTGADFRIGLYDTYLSTMGGGENLLAVFIEFLEEHISNAQIEILTHEREYPDVEEIAERFNVTLQRTQIRRLPTTERNHLRPLQPLRRYFSERDLAHCSSQYDLFVNNTIFSLAHSRALYSIYMCMFPLDPVPWQLRDRPLGRALFRPYVELRRHFYRKWISSYTLVIAISEFTRTWIHRLWGLDSKILYPPVDTLGKLSLRGKRNIILSVGRFFPGSHNKKHDVLIDAFKDLRRKGFKNWELHLVGGRTPVPGTDGYIRELRSKAEGEPVHFHIDAPSESLKSLMKSAKLYWHATGCNENQLMDPYKLEHFGISTVEAMSYGCVPAAFACGGQIEIIENGESGLLWSDADELVGLSSEILQNSERLTKMARLAHRRSQDFNRAAFKASARQLLREAVPLPEYSELDSPNGISTRDASPRKHAEGQSPR